ncbi:ATP-binding protein [Catelliglobosispora koreensis]|uniref:ATP-binding protein n=1 Tax=Catelliglobosispora koreensis TaxID=129052 RepID=UPI00036FB57E|nr:ATP-binding protein [Catelliglobosispora koreensis]
MPQALPKPRLARSRDDRLIAGVASGIAAHLGIKPTFIRAGFVLLMPLNGLGALLYAVFWVFLPSQQGPGKPARRDLLKLLPYLVVAAALVTLAALFSQGDPFSLGVGWLVALIAAGGGIIWHQAQRQTTPANAAKGWLGALTSSGNQRLYLLQFLAGAVLVVAGVIGLLIVYAPVRDMNFDDLWKALAFALIAVAGVALVAAPVLWQTMVELRSERVVRIREQERAELAAMIHDQVLHTLALIQRNSADPATVQRLARGQERSLRNWLYQPTGSPNEHFAAALEQAAAEVEDTYGIAVESVVVGDRTFDDKVGALVAAAREAMVNASRHAGVKTISLYAEAEPSMLSVFVRDRGAGFDLDSIEENRHGVRGSIIGRMDRHGGTAEIRSVSGEGTEVRLMMPVTTAKQEEVS